MSNVNALSERIDALEMRLAYQDVTIETLNHRSPSSGSRSMRWRAKWLN